MRESHKVNHLETTEYLAEKIDRLVVGFPSSIRSAHGFVLIRDTVFRVGDGIVGEEAEF